MTLRLQSSSSSLQLSITLIALLFVWGVSTVHAQDRDATFPDPSSVDKKSTTVQNVTDALDLSSSQVSSVDFVGSDPTGYTTFSQVASNFPQEGGSFLTLSSGCAGSALDPDDEDSFSCDISGDGPGEATDIVRMELELNVPSGASTVKFDLKYLSEEFPEFVGSSFNDAFVVETGQSTFTVDSNFNLIAPDNLVFDGNGDPITINTTGATGMTSGGSVGTTYDGGTSVLTTTVQLPSNQSTVKLIFSIFDVSDQIYDSTIFLDNMRFQQSQNLELTGLEANQAIQDWQNDVQLIEDKSTTVRAFIQSKTSSSAPVGNVSLQGFQNGNPLPGSPLSPANGGGFQAPPQTSNSSTIQDRRADMSKSLNFRLPNSWLSGTVDLQLTGGTVDCSPAAATNDACEFQEDFISVPTPEVRVARIKWTDPQGNTHIPSQAHVREQMKRIIALYPISTMNWQTFTVDWDNTKYSSPPVLDSVNAHLQKLRNTFVSVGGDPDAMFYGDMVNTGNGGLAAGIPADVASGDQQVTDNVAAHELGHVLNQQHSVNQADNGTDASGNWKRGYCAPNRAFANLSAPEYPFTNAAKDLAALGPVQQGLDSQMWGVDTRTQQAVDARTRGDLMSYCSVPGSNLWISSWRYNKLRTDPNALDDRFSAPASLANTASGQTSEYKLIGGLISLTDTTAEFSSFQTVEAEQSDIELITPPEGDYTLQLLASGDVVDEIPFAPAVNHGFKVGIPETATFLVPAPEDAEVDEVRLLGPGEGSSAVSQNPIASVTASANPPTITVDSPNGGEELSGETATFEWTASDEDGDELDYTVEYSRDGGTSWTVLATNVTSSTYEADLSTLGKTEEGLLRVRASDGFNSAADSSDGTFSVPNSDPQPFITSPDSGGTIDSTSAIPLKGNVNDVEDDQFDDANLSWLSSIDGDLGTGRTLNVGEQLSVGTHTITFLATDSDGGTGTASVELQVVPGAQTVGETPVAVEQLLVDTDSLFSFGGTGVKLGFTGVSGSDSVTVEKFDSAPAVGSDNNIEEDNLSEFRYVINAGSGVDFDSTEVRFMLSTLSGVSDNVSEGDIVIYSRPNEGTGSFSKLTTTLDDKGDDDPSNDEIFATVGSLSEFALASNTEPLPVEIASFKGTTIEENQVRLTWQTASETNNAGFEVQRRAGEQDSWTKVNFVESKAAGGTTSEAKSYQFKDADLPYAADKLEYRLRQVDLDGSESLSEPVIIQRAVDEVELLGTFPNPARTQATIRFAVPEQQSVTLRMYDVLGRQVQTIVDGEREGRQSMQVNVSDLPSGVYFLRLEAESQMKTQRMTVVR